MAMFLISLCNVNIRIKNLISLSNVKSVYVMLKLELKIIEIN